MRRITLAATACALAIGTVAIAGGHGGNPAVQARNAHMGLYSFNLGALGAMAKGETEYDAELATALASDLAAVAGLSQVAYWPEGTAQGEVEGSRAKAEIWSDPEGFEKITTAMAEASAALAQEAGKGLEALQAGIGPVGKACGDCHKAYRGPRN